MIYAPRPQFLPFHLRRQRWAALVCHRRAGKTVASVNELLTRALASTKPDPRFGYPDLDFVDDIFRIRAQYGTMLAGQQSAKTRSMIDELAAGGRTRNPQISGEQYQNTVSALRSEAETAFRSRSKVK